MMLTYQEFKMFLLDTGIFKKTGRKGQYRCQECPFCGDMKAHMYVKISLDNPQEPVLYYCFKCNAFGFINQEFLSYYGIENTRIPKCFARRKLDTGGYSVKQIDLIHDNDDVSAIVSYIQQRVGVTPTMEELKQFQVIADPAAYVKMITGSDAKFTNDRIWFKCANGSMTGRSVDDHASRRWVKYTIEGSVGKMLYTIKKPVDLLKPINVLICEGVIDCFGLYYHYPIDNAMYIACLGSHYDDGIQYMIDRGIFGDSVYIKIFKDNDVKTVKPNKRLWSFFKNVSIYHNTEAKDYGVPSEKIFIEKCL